MEDSVCASFPKIEIAKIFLYAMSKKYTKFSKNGKNEPYDNHWVNVCFESNIIDVSYDTWWIDSGATIHACNSMQATVSRKSPTSLEQYMHVHGRRYKSPRFFGSC